MRDRSRRILAACLVVLAVALVGGAVRAEEGGGGDAASTTVTSAGQSSVGGTSLEGPAKSKGWQDRLDDAFGVFNGWLDVILFYKLFGRFPLAVLWLVLGSVFFTVRMGFINIRAFKHAIMVTAGRYDNPEDEGEVTHFQALSAALSATVGLGNIAGVAIAITMGGPGATFWMIIAGLVGMSAKFVECTLGQRYREVRPDGRVMGGAMYYLSRGLAELRLAPLGRVFAVVFAILCIGGSLAGGNAFQVNQSLNAVEETIPALKGHGWVYGLVMVVLVGIVIIGGLRRIAKTASRIVPLMCCVYVLAALAILVMNADRVPGAMVLIVTRAFSMTAVKGGIIGVLVIGFQRAAFSNEAGIGSAAIAHSGARTEYPVREGIVALLGPFIDTVIVCTMTALVIVITGAWDADVYAPTLERRATVEVRELDRDADQRLSEAELPARLKPTAGSEQPALRDFDSDEDGSIEPGEFSAWIVADHQHVLDEKQGAKLTSRAMGAEIPFFQYVLAVAVILFAYSTLISWSYYGERCWSYLFGDGKSLSYRLLFLVFVFLGSIVSAPNVLQLGDYMILGMALPNILGVLLLSGIVKRDLDEYWRKYKAGDFDRDKTEDS